ncbi:MAG: bifunctional riboflavin kinase/FAD synthetase [Bacteroidia bacterium]
MQVYHSISEFPELPYPVVTTGTFDGVHLGHQTILRRLIEIASKNKGQSVVVTFHPHPRLVLQPENNSLELLNTLEERIQHLERAGVEHLLVIPFTKEFASLSSLDFIRLVLVNGVKTKRLVIGYDHHFGKNREGSFENLNKMGPVYGFNVEEIPAKDIDEVAISSTRIRKALHAGDIATANEFLGYAYPFEGEVIHGQHLGSGLGFPTANVELPEKRKLIPANGVYAVMVKCNLGNYKGMMNIGIRPTVSSSTEKHIEVNLFDFEGDLYGQCIQISMQARIRDEKKFSGLDELRTQLENDKIEASQLLTHI